MVSCTTDNAARPNGASDPTVPASDSSSAHQASSASSLHADASPNGMSIVCIGDSITYGYGLASPETDSWPALLQQNLGEGCQVVNLGESGTTLMDEGEYPYRSTGYLEQAKELAPDVFIVMLGSNDAFSYRWSEESYRYQLGVLVDELRASSPGARIVLMAPPRTFYEYAGYGAEGIDDVVIGGQIRSAVQDTATGKACDFVDLYAFTAEHFEWFPDCLHPNSQGHRAIADHLREVLFPLGK